jgi:hypothetical protein
VPGPVRCRCGAILVDELTDDEVTPVGGDAITFRRTTDYIVCSDCNRVYRVSDLRSGHSTDESLIGTQQTGESLVETLERLLEREQNGDEPA